MWLPKPYPDELIGSVIARGRFRSGLQLKPFLRCVFGKGRNSYAFLMAGDAVRLGRLTGLAPEELLARHTVLPYAISFMSCAEKQKHWARALNPAPLEKAVSALTHNVSIGVPFRRICPTCIEDDLARYGEAYFHRAHHLPGLLICLTHRVRLRDSFAPLRGEAHTTDARLPCDGPSSVRDLGIELPVMEIVAQLTQAALRVDLGEARNWTTEYRAAAASKGYAITRDALASGRLAVDFQRFFGNRFLVDAGCEVARGTQPWPALLLRPGTAHGLPTPKHVLLQTFLKAGPRADAVLGYRRPGKPGADFGKLDRGAANALSALLRREAGTGKRYTVPELLGAVGVWQAFRHNRASFPLTSALVQAFRSSDMAERQAGRRPYWRKRLGLEAMAEEFPSLIRLDEPSS